MQITSLTIDRQSLKYHSYRSSPCAFRITSSLIAISLEASHSPSLTPTKYSHVPSVGS